MTDQAYNPMYKCPQCDQMTQIEVIMTDATVRQLVGFIDEDSWSASVDGDDILDYETIRFQCNECGHEINIDEDELAHWYWTNTQ